MKPRPLSLKDVADQAESLGDFGRTLRDWLHALRRFTSRQQAAAAIAREPRPLHDKFAGGNVADAWLAAYAEHLASKLGLPPPQWAFKPWRIAAEPAFDEETRNPELRALALARSPLAFQRRNIFTPSVDLPLALRAGRPRKSADEKRQTNANRQRRFREARAAELKRLRKAP